MVVTRKGDPVISGAGPAGRSKSEKRDARDLKAFHLRSPPPPYAQWIHRETRAVKLLTKGGSRGPCYGKFSACDGPPPHREPFLPARGAPGAGKACKSMYQIDLRGYCASSFT